MRLTERPMNEIAALSRKLRRNPGKWDAVLEEFVRGRDFPLTDGDQATFFYWDGKPTESVHLMHWVFGLPSRMALLRLADTDAFYLPLELPAGARMEYKFEVVRSGKGEWRTDPRNPRMARDPFGQNSVCPAGSYREPEWTHQDLTLTGGTWVPLRFRSEAFGDERAVIVYRPEGFRPKKAYPLLVVHDGLDYLYYASMKVVLDNLIHRQEVEPILVAFTSGVARNIEYAANPLHADFLKNELVPLMEEQFNILPGPGHRGLMGASFGAVASLHAAVRYPNTWGRLLLQSGSFAFTDIGPHQKGPLWDPIVAFVNRFREHPPRLNAHIYASCGTFESLIYYNRSVLPLFHERADAVRYSEVPDGHNWLNWRDRLGEALPFLFPGPLWMYYE